MAFFPDIEVSTLTTSGLAWLFVTFGYTLFQASNLISEGSDLLLLVPATAGIVGSCVLPVLGAVPDAAIMLFSGLGDLAEVQDQLAVGVGALSGSTIMLLTVPWAIATFGGRVDLDVQGSANYRGRPKLSRQKAWRLSQCGTTPGPQVRTGAVAMMVTAISYVVIQYPCVVIESRGGQTKDVALGEKWFAFVGLCTCMVGFVAYLAFQVLTSGTEHDFKGFRADEVIKQKLKAGKITLAGAMQEMVAREVNFFRGGAKSSSSGPSSSDYDAVSSTDDDSSSLRDESAVRARLENIVRPFFKMLDKDSSGTIDESEAGALLVALGEKVTPQRLTSLFKELDANESGGIELDELVQGLAKYLRTSLDKSMHGPASEEDADEEEEDEVPEDISHLSPAKQQAVIKRRALFKLVLGTALVLIFSDPMVDVLSEIGARTGVPPFYVSFVLAPLATNASELLSAFFYSLKKTSKAITVSYTALEGAACMNNTLALAIFNGLVFFRGIAWQYTAETISILLVELLVAFVAFKKTQTLADSLLVLSFYPFSIAVVAVLENGLGLD
mmetsp:Transcript_13060/g.39468  ORF Transcript_13060/g.39468 Transcript_13060/m.39468 type:complete len:557 (-) Transcript_13060:21-1691(-)|eukprot:CAMPEP_0198644662 /NCGR_PEP_ID=MMETSP1467-20131203/765_1 /TAXON_ID=1462469 /ORGANISM="unid. sp., Strain CCMP2135" /LENGTH=556 /DNA_ID=CAMNT_0044380125 /DNA_START=198 /DNA_END=1868 /DNA_ORIENTATION=-